VSSRLACTLLDGELEDTQNKPVGYQTLQRTLG